MMYRLLALTFILMLGADCCSPNNEVKVTGDGAAAVEVVTKRVKYLRCITDNEGLLLFDGYVDKWNVWQDGSATWWVDGQKYAADGVDCMAVSGNPDLLILPPRRADAEQQ